MAATPVADTSFPIAAFQVTHCGDRQFSDTSTRSTEECHPKTDRFKNRGRGKCPKLFCHICKTQSHSAYHSYFRMDANFQRHTSSYTPRPGGGGAYVSHPNFGLAPAAYLTTAPHFQSSKALYHRCFHLLCNLLSCFRIRLGTWTVAQVIISSLIWPICLCILPMEVFPKWPWGVDNNFLSITQDRVVSKSLSLSLSCIMFCMFLH